MCSIERVSTFPFDSKAIMSSFLLLQIFWIVVS
jgi:hypothetical protein